jgi:hypothetical protein
VRWKDKKKEWVGKEKKERRKENRKNELSKFLEIMIRILYWLYYYQIIKIEDVIYM